MRGSTSRLEREDLEIDLGSHPRPATYLLHDLANPPNRLSLSFLGSITGIRLPPYQAYAKQFCGSNVNAFTPLPGQGQVLPGYLPPIVLQARPGSARLEGEQAFLRDPWTHGSLFLQKEVASTRSQREQERSLEQGLLAPKVQFLPHCTGPELTTPNQGTG